MVCGYYVDPFGDIAIRHDAGRWEVFETFFREGKRIDKWQKWAGMRGATVEILARLNNWEFLAPFE